MTLPFLTFISRETAKNKYPAEMLLSCCDDRIFYSRLKKLDVRCYNPGIIAKFANSAERIRTLASLGVDFCKYESAQMALLNPDVEVGRFILSRYNIFTSLFRPDCMTFPNIMMQAEDLSTLFHLLQEFDIAEPYNMDYIFKVNTSCGWKRYIYETAFILSSGAFWTESMKSSGCEKMLLKTFLHYIRQGSDSSRCGLLPGMTFQYFSGDLPAESDLHFARLLMILDLLAWYDFPVSSRAVFRQNIQCLMKMNDGDFLRTAGYKKKLSAGTAAKLLQNKTAYENIALYIAGVEDENLLAAELAKTAPGIKKVSSLLRCCGTFPEVLYRKGCPGSFANKKIFDLCCRYGMDLSRTFAGRWAIRYCIIPPRDKDTKQKLPEECIKKILDAVPVNGIDECDNTQLYYAVTQTYGGDDDIADMLLKSGADVNVRHTSLESLIFNCSSPALLRKLLRQGIDVNARNRDGKTAVLYNASHHEFLSILLEYGADIHVRDNHWRGVYHHLVRRRRIWNVDNIMKCLALFKSCGVDINSRDKDGNTPLHLLSESIALPHMIDNPLFNDDFRKDGMKIAAQLIADGASEDIVNNQGLLPSEYLKQLMKGK